MGLWYGIDWEGGVVRWVCGTGVVQNATYSYVWDVVVGEEKNVIFLKPAHLAIIGQHCPTPPLLCLELDTITWYTQWRHLGVDNRLHKESTEQKFGACHPFVSKLWASGAWLISVDFDEFSTGDLVTRKFEPSEIWLDVKLFWVYCSRGKPLFVTN